MSVRRGTHPGFVGKKPPLYALADGGFQCVADSAADQCFRHERILENAVKIAENANKLIIRVPVIPTFNDTEAEIASIAKFASTLKGVEEINLLPYHNYGKDKYEGLGREYPMGDIPMPSDEHMQKLKAVAESFGLKCKIGG
jgi:pyruvate formate lyase activating enzyme